MFLLSYAVNAICRMKTGAATPWLSTVFGSSQVNHILFLLLYHTGPQCSDCGYVSHALPRLEL
jgi:hypothetical protein